MTEGLEWNWRFVPELFEVDDSLQAAIDEGIAPDPREFEEEYRAAIAGVLAAARLEAPADQRPIVGGRRGHHSEHLGHLLAVMQFLPRTYPDAKWEGNSRACTRTSTRCGLPKSCPRRAKRTRSGSKFRQSFATASRSRPA